MQSREQKHQQELLAAVIESQEAERKRVAKDLHDNLGALLTTAKLSLNQFRRKVELEESQTGRLDTTQEILEESIDSVRKTAHQLIPPTLEKFGLSAVLLTLVHQVNASTDTQVELLGSELERLQPQAELALYRIVQELLNNGLKHAGASRICLLLEPKGDELHMRYEDDGKGFDPERLFVSGLGLKNLESRANLLQGSFVVESAPRSGARFYFTFPWKSICLNPKP